MSNHGLAVHQDPTGGSLPTEGIVQTLPAPAAKPALQIGKRAGNRGAQPGMNGRPVFEPDLSEIKWRRGWMRSRSDARGDIGI